ncbi:lipase family protein [Bacillus sp. AFS041924]|uniref:lipase family protein n=1 Tax=Bacillus sp. AFS041924 TaxID=2033503 RepID=UPI000BFC6032|nr:lipase family protein [Bacillus sp. AFS041924]PGS56302.1 lipase [Bacillus sp. AFS041924]
MKFLSVDYDKALELLLCIEQAYVQFDNDGKFIIPARYTLVDTIKARAIRELEWFGYIIENDESVIIVFRGTISDLDWLADLKIDQDLFPYVMNGGNVHSGFLSIYQSCREMLLVIVKEKALSKKIFITGHSLGGSLAMLLGYEIAMTGICNPNVYSFGSPKVGNTKFKENYDENIRHSLRFVNLYDMVPLSPPFKIELKPLKIYLEYVQVKHPITFALNKGSIRGSHDLSTYIEGVKKMKLDYDYTPTFTYKMREVDPVEEVVI